MDLEAFAAFLKNYGAYAMATVFAGLYMLERRERRETQKKYETYLQRAPDQLRELGEATNSALDSLERAFIKSGIETEDTDNEHDGDD